MEPSLTIPAAPFQSPSLWAMLLVLIQIQIPQRFLGGIALPARLHAGCEPVPSGSLAPLPSIPRKFSPSISRPFPFLPATAPDAAGPAPGSRPSYVCPTVIEANPTMSATPATARATAANFAIRSHRRGVRTGGRSRVPSLPESNAGRVLQGLLPLHTIATDAANPAIGSSCGRIPGTGTAAPISESSPRLSRRLGGNIVHALRPAPGHHPAPLARTVYRTAAEAPPPTERPHFERRVARRQH